VAKKFRIFGKIYIMALSDTMKKVQDSTVYPIDPKAAAILKERAAKDTTKMYSREEFIQTLNDIATGKLKPKNLGLSNSFDDDDDKKPKSKLNALKKDVKPKGYYKPQDDDLIQSVGPVLDTKKDTVGSSYVLKEKNHPLNKLKARIFIPNSSETERHLQVYGVDEKDPGYSRNFTKSQLKDYLRHDEGDRGTRYHYDLTPSQRKKLNQ